MFAKVSGKETGTVVTALAAQVQHLPKALRQALTWDCGKERPIKRACRWRPSTTSASAIPTARGNAATTRTPTASCAHNARKAQTCLSTPKSISMPSLANSTNGPNARIDGLTKLIEQHAWLDADARRLMRMPGIGPITASAIVAAIGDASQFKTARDLAAWLGLTPLNKSSGGRERLGRITKKGDRYIRKLLIIGMTSRALVAKAKPEKPDTWTAKLLDEKPFRLATVAMANKSARIIWAILTKGEEYRQPIT